MNKASDHPNSFKKPVNEANSKILAAVDYDKLAQKYNPYIIEKAVNTMCSHTETFQEGDFKKLATSHEIYAKPDQYTSEEVHDSHLCINYAICE